MLNEPRAIEAELVGERDLLERLGEHTRLIAFRPRTWHLVFVEQPELQRGPLLRARATRIEQL